MLIIGQMQPQKKTPRSLRRSCRIASSAVFQRVDRKFYQPRLLQIAFLPLLCDNHVRSPICHLSTSGLAMVNDAVQYTHSSFQSQGFNLLPRSHLTSSLRCFQSLPFEPTSDGNGPATIARGHSVRFFAPAIQCGGLLKRDAGDTKATA